MTTLEQRECLIMGSVMCDLLEFKTKQEDVQTEEQESLRGIGFQKPRNYFIDEAIGNYRENRSPESLDRLKQILYS